MSLLNRQLLRLNIADKIRFDLRLPPEEQTSPAAIVLESPSKQSRNFIIDDSKRNHAERPVHVQRPSFRLGSYRYFHRIQSQ